MPSLSGSDLTGTIFPLDDAAGDKTHVSSLCRADEPAEQGAFCTGSEQLKAGDCRWSRSRDESLILREGNAGRTAASSGTASGSNSLVSRGKSSKLRTSNSSWTAGVHRGVVSWSCMPSCLVPWTRAHTAGLNYSLCASDLG